MDMKESHEKGIEAAVYAFYGTSRSKPSEGNIRDMQDAIKAYLYASGMVMVPWNPTDKMVKAADWWTKLVGPYDEADTPEERCKEFETAWKAMIEAHPNPFQTPEESRENK